MNHRYLPETLLPAFRQAFQQLVAGLDPDIARWLKCRRVVSRHGTCNTVLCWTIWDRRQTQATLPPGYFCWAINYDPDHFETSSTDWCLKLHMNTVRIHHNGLDVRRYLLKEIPPIVPQSFRWVVHPRQLVVEYPFHFSGTPSELPGLVLPPLERLIAATHPVIRHLLEAFGSGLDSAERAAFIANRTIPHRRAANGASVPVKGHYSHSIPAILRAAVLKRHGCRCAICGKAIPRDSTPHIDHIVPFAQGGLTVLENLQPTHPACNLAKGSLKLPADPNS